VRIQGLACGFNGKPSPKALIKKAKQLFGAGSYLENNFAQLRLQCGWQNGNVFEMRSRMVRFWLNFLAPHH
jgi:hypothetical protein